MAGTVTTVAVLGVTAAFAVALITAASAESSAVRLGGVADAAALAAADAASGAVIGIPCERAAQIASVSGVRLTECEVVGPIATVGVTDQFLHFDVTARARAGPAPWDGEIADQ